MSRSDLDRIQSRLKVAIQNHQILVSKMKVDPQNANLQVQLHELQSQITSLSDKQRNIVQLLRKELVTKPNQDGISPSVSPALPSPVQTLIRPPTPLANSATPLPPVLLNMDATRSVVTLPAGLPGAIVPKESSAGLLNNNNKAVLTTSQKANTTPLRVPQFHNRPSIFQGGAVRQVPSKMTNSPLVPVSARRGHDTDLSNYRRLSINKDASPEERTKLEFMASLDLITQDTLKDLQNRRSERKRRSTANPQFSYGHFEPENDVHEDFCAVCRRSGELLMCDTCNLVYHLTCLEPPMGGIPNGMWSCPKCLAMNKQSGTNWPGTLALVHSYITHKAAKEEEKSKLAKQVTELQTEKKLLEIRAKELTESIAQQVQRKSEMTVAYSTAQQSVDKLKNLIRVFQTS